MRISRNRIARASYSSRRPTSGSPWPISSLIVSVAWMTPITPGNTPKTPTSLHDGTRPGRGRGGVEAAVARPRVRREDAYLALKLEDAAVHDRLPDQHRGIVHQVARGKIVRAVDDDVIVLEERHNVIYREALGIHAHLDIRVEGVERQRGG